MSPEPLSFTIVDGPQIPAGTVTGAASNRDPIDKFELDFAHRALALLKERIGPEKMFELLKPDLDKADQYWRDAVAKSGSKDFTPAAVEYDVRGLAAADFLKYFGTLHQPGQLPSLLSAHPEHWNVTPINSMKGQAVFETLGAHPTRFEIPDLGAPASAAIAAYRDASFPIAMTGRGFLFGADLAIGEVLHEFKDHQDGRGFNVRLKIFYPASTMDDGLVEIHRRHLLVEFRNWITDAYQYTHRQS